MKTIKNKNIVINIIILMLVIVGGYLYSFIDIKYDLYKNDKNSFNNIKEIQYIKNKFLFKDNKINGIKLYLKINGNKKYLKLFCRIVDKNNNMILEESKSCNKLKSKNFNIIKFKRAYKVKKNERYNVYISYKSYDKRSTVSFFKNKQNKYLVSIITTRFNVETFIMFIVLIYIIIFFSKYLIYIFKN